MACTHNVAMAILGRVKHARTIPGMQEYGTLANKLLRTYAAQIEALAKLRRGGEQKVVVKHVHVYAGGKAFVGAVSNGPQGERGNSTNGHQPHGPDLDALAYAPGTPLPGPEPGGEPLPVSSCEGETEMPAPRRRERKRRAIRRA
jgi:hypothetical protein